MNVHNARLLTDSIITVLTGAGLVVGDAVAPGTVPAGAGWVVVYGLTGGFVDGPLGDPHEDASAIYQLTAVAPNRRQCEWTADKARTTILSAALNAGPGRTVAHVAVDMLGGTIRDDDVQPFVFYSPDRYRIWTTPT